MTDKINIGNAITMGQLLEFAVAFPNEKPLPIKQYLAGGNKNIILNASAFFLGFKNHQSEFDDNLRFLKMFFREENADFANQIYNNIKEFEKRGIHIKIINSYTSLNLFEYFFSQPDEKETQTEAEFERNLFKAYLILNSEFTEKQSIVFSSCELLDDKLKIPMLMFCMEYPVSDKTNYDINQIWVTQMIKAIYLFQFLEANIKARPLLTAFLVILIQQRGKII